MPIDALVSDSGDFPERERLEKVVAGDRQAFAELVAPLLPRLLGTAVRMVGSRSEAEDAVQDALASVWIARNRIDARKPLLPYLTTITLNKCRDRLRRRRSAALFGFGSAEDFDFIATEAPSPETQSFDRQQLQRAYRAIQRLPIRLREALILVTIDGQSQREAGELLGVTEKTIETRIHRARKLLREGLEKI